MAPREGEPTRHGDTPSGARHGPPAGADLTTDPLLRGCRTDRDRRPTLGRITLLSQLGKGGMGVVYLGVNPRLGTEVAVKVLPWPRQRDDANLVRRFVREARLAASLRSDHLVSVLDVDRDDDSGNHFIVMEYVRGQSAGAWLRALDTGGRAGAPEAAALDVCIAAAKGLAAAHVAGVVHRDVKPDNILIPAGDGGLLQLTKAKLADLGLACAEGGEQNLTGNAVALGTPGYMAPEQAQDAKRAKKPADVFAMGATLYALLTGRAPFCGSTAMDAILKTLQCAHVPVRDARPDVSAPTAALIDHCLAKDPARRYRDAPALLEALELCRASLSGAGEPGEATSLVAKLVEAEERGERVRSNRSGNEADEPPPPGRPSSARTAFTRRPWTRGAAVAGIVVTAAVCAAIAARSGASREGSAAPVDGAPTAAATAPGPRDDAPPPADAGVRTSGAAPAVAEPPAPANVRSAPAPAPAAGTIDPALVDPAKWDAASTAERRAVAESVALREPAFRLLRLESFRADGVAHEMAIYAHDTTGLEFVLVPAGTFRMGSPESEDGRESDETPHDVTLTRPFLIARTECTQAAYRKVTGANPSKSNRGEAFPVESVSWDDAQAFCTKAGLRLPTEAQWEYACRSGTSTRFACGDGEDRLIEFAWYFRNSGVSVVPQSMRWDSGRVVGDWKCSTREVAAKPAQAFGIHDMHGNVREWCEDTYADLLASPVTDPKGPASGTVRVNRGGSWYDDARRLRSADRSRYATDYRDDALGLRPVRVLARD